MIDRRHGENMAATSTVISSKMTINNPWLSPRRNSLKKWLHNDSRYYLKLVYYHYYHDIYIYIYIYIHTYIHRFIHSYIHTYIHTYIDSYIHSFIHSCIHSFIHSYIYIYILYMNVNCLTRDSTNIGRHAQVACGKPSRSSWNARSGSSSGRWPVEHRAWGKVVTLWWIDLLPQ